MFGFRRCGFLRGAVAAAALLVLAPALAAAQLVERVVDGDTIIVRGAGRVRLIGVDTPESVDPRRPVEFFGKEASAFTERLVEGKRVRLEYDRDRTDRYGRTLAYVHLPDGTFVNAEIIRRGYGHAYTRFPFKHRDRFRQLEREARDARRGLWGATPAQTSGGVGVVRTGVVRAGVLQPAGGGGPLGRQRQRPHHVRRGPAARDRAGAPRPRGVPLHARRRRRRRRVRVSQASSRQRATASASCASESGVEQPARGGRPGHAVRKRPPRR